MSLLTEQIEKARSRSQGLDLRRLTEEQKDKSPKEIAAPEELAARQRFLQDSLAPDAELTFERIIEGNELQPVNYLELGMLAARSICRIKLFDARGVHCGWGSGFLVAPEVLLTNNHVFPSAAAAGRSVAQFDVELDVFGGDKPMAEFRIEPERLFYSHAPLDFTVVAIAPRGAHGERLASYGFLPLIGATGKVVDGEWLTIVQHPEGKRKHVCVRENKLLTRTDDVLWYSTDTLGGSSGSPVFNNGWQVVALHHKGVPEEKNGRIQTVDGRDFDPGRDREDVIKWIANEGIRVSRIVQTLRAERPGHPLLADVFEMSPARARQVTEELLASLTRAVPASPVAPLAPEAAPTPRSTPPMQRSVTVTLDIARDGSVSLRGGGHAAESWLERESRTTRKPRPPEIDVPFDPDYSKREGYREDFLDGPVIHAPDASALLDQAAPLLAVQKPKAAADYTLKYINYSLMMHKERRLALWTAANVNGSERHLLGRPRDQWRTDPRISLKAQLGEFYYKGNNFDRGHLTRREDLEFGRSPEEALASAADTFHLTNCAPQHSEFNQIGNPWQDLEVHVLENSIKAGRFRAQIFTGPVLAEDDPVWERFPEIQYPVLFWKIAVAVAASGKPFAAAFLLDQSGAIREHGIETAEVPFGPFRTFQTPVAEIERLTGLRFTYAESAGGDVKPLSEVDPLAQGAPGVRRARRSRVRAEEALGVSLDAPDDYLLLSDAASMILPED